MTIKNTNLDGILAELTRRKAEKQAGEQGDKDTTHPIADAPNSTQDASTGSSASEDSSDVKDQQPVGVENTGGPSEEANPSGSMGVEDKKPNEGADLDNGDTKGTSEMANKDTTHPSADGTKRGEDQYEEAMGILDEAIKKASAEKTAEEAQAEKLAAYAKELETDHADAVADGEKFAEHVLQTMQAEGEEMEKQAAARLYNAGSIRTLLKLAASAEDLAAMGGEPGLDQAAMELADQGVDPAELEAALAAEAGGMPEEAGMGGEEAELAELAAQLEEAGVTPEELEAALMEAEAGGAAPEEGTALAPEEGMALAPEEEQAALDAAMGEAEVTPEEIAAAGGELPMEVIGSAGKVKIAQDKQAAFLKLKDQLVKELKQMKEGAAK